MMSCMLNRMKKLIILFGSILLITIILTGCSTKNDNHFMTTVSMGSMGGDNTYNDYGVFNAENGIVYYCDPENGTRTPICTKINCEHQGISQTNPFPECNAYFSTFVNCTAVLGDSFYCVKTPENEGLFIKEFIKSDVDGTNRKVLYRADDICYFGSGRYEAGYFVYTFYNQEDKDGNKLEKNQIGMVILNLATDEIKRIDIEDAYSGKILTTNINDGYIYYMLSYNSEDLSKYDYNYIVSEEGKEKLKDISKIEVWKINIENGEKSIYDISTEDMSSYRLDYGYLMKGYDGDKTFEFTELSTGKKYYINDDNIQGANIMMCDQGVLITKDGTVRLYKYGAYQIEKIGEYEEDYLGIQWVTDNWVYVLRETGGSYRYSVCPRKDFFNGDLKWKDLNLHGEISTDDGSVEGEKGTEKDDTKNIDNEKLDKEEEIIIKKHPESYYVHWAYPVPGAEINEEYVNKLNARLEKDGYDFGVKFVKITETFDTDAYEEGICANEDIDIAYVTMQLNGKNLPETLVTDGKVFDISEMAANSPYFLNMHKLIKESVTINGRIYHFPNETTQNGRKQYIISSITDARRWEKIKDNMIEIDGLVSENNKVYYGWTGFDFARCFGYDYDTVRGIVASTDGTIINPLENEKFIEWMNTVNKWYKNDMVINVGNEIVKAGCPIVMTIGTGEDATEQKQLVCSWNQKMCKRILGTNVILTGSDKKEEAFKLIELLRTNHDYGNLLIYGHTESENPDEEPSAWGVKDIIGIDDGLLRGVDGFSHFASTEERNDFYENNVEASVTLYMDLPFECTELCKIVEKYLGYDNSILFRDGYEEKLQEFKKEYTDKFNEIMELMENEQ